MSDLPVEVVIERLRSAVDEAFENETMAQVHPALLERAANLLERGDK